MGKWHLNQNHIAKKVVNLVRTNLWRQKFNIACGWQECHAGLSILQFLAGHLPVAICTLREACRRFDAEKSLKIGYQLDLWCLDYPSCHSTGWNFSSASWLKPSMWRNVYHLLFQLQKKHFLRKLRETSTQLPRINH